MFRGTDHSRRSTRTAILVESFLRFDSYLLVHNSILFAARVGRSDGSLQRDKVEVDRQEITGELLDSEEDKKLGVQYVKKALSTFIKDTTKARFECESIRKVLAKMYSSDLLVDNSIYEWALGEISSLDQTII